MSATCSVLLFLIFFLVQRLVRYMYVSLGSKQYGTLSLIFSYFITSLSPNAFRSELGIMIIFASLMSVIIAEHSTFFYISAAQHARTRKCQIYSAFHLRINYSNLFYYN